jgi:hypothetical protein
LLDDRLADAPACLLATRVTSAAHSGSCVR